MKKILFLAFIFSSAANAQPAFFEKVFGDSSDNSYAQSVVQLPSGKLLVATNNFNISGNTIKLFVFDDAGNNLDTIAYFTPATSQQYVNRMKRSDGFIYIAGYKYNGTSFSDGFLLKADTSGSIIWSKSYGGATTNESFQGLSLAGNTVYVSGYTTNQNGTGNSMYVMKLDSAGMVLWDYAYSYPYNSTSDAIIPLPGGDIIASGDKLLGSVYTNFLLRLNGGGNFVWDFDLPNPNNNGCKNDFLSASGDIYIVGESASLGNFTFDPTVTKIDTAHNIYWSFIYPGAANSTDAAMDMIEPVPENFLVTGYGVNPANSSADVFLMRIDSSGTEINRVYFGDSTIDIPYCIINGNGTAGCYIAGTTDRNGYNQSYLIYTGLSGIPVSLNNALKITHPANIFPNPSATNNIVVQLKNNFFENVEIEISNIVGEQIIKQNFKTENNLLHIDVSKLISGTYFLKINSGNEFFISKFIKL